MYKNLKAEMARFNITQKELADTLNIKSLPTISLKLNKKSKFTLDQAFKIRDLIENKSNIKYEISYLFEEE